MGSILCSAPLVYLVTVIEPFRVPARSVHPPQALQARCDGQGIAKVQQAEYIIVFSESFSHGR
jgi:hypothetical protein